MVVVFEDEDELLSEMLLKLKLLNDSRSVLLEFPPDTYIVIILFQVSKNKNLA